MTTEERLKIVERELAAAKRRARWLLCGAGVAVVGTALAAALAHGKPMALAQDSGAVSKEIRANRFVVEDGAGNERVVLEISEKDGPGLKLLDEDGKERVELLISEYAAGLSLRDENGKERAMLRVNNYWAGLSLRDVQDANSSAGLDVDKHGPGLMLMDDKGNSSAWLRVRKDGAALMLDDENGKLRAWLDVGKDGASLDLRGENDKSSAVIGAGTTKTPDGRTITYPESSIRLFGKDGMRIWGAP